MPYLGSIGHNDAAFILHFVKHNLDCFTEWVGLLRGWVDLVGLELDPMSGYLTTKVVIVQRVLILTDKFFNVLFQNCMAFSNETKPLFECP